MTKLWAWPTVHYRSCSVVGAQCPKALLLNWCTLTRQPPYLLAEGIEMEQPPDGHMLSSIQAGLHHLWPVLQQHLIGIFPVNGPLDSQAPLRADPVQQQQRQGGILVG